MAKNTEEKKSGKIKKILLWICFIFFALATFIYWPGFAAVLFAVVAITTFPLEKWQGFIGSKLPEKLKKIRVLVVTILAVWGIVIAPADAPEEDAGRSDITIEESMASSEMATEAPLETEVSAEELQATSETTVTPTTVPTPETGSYFEVHYIDVGQADAAVVMCDDKYMLVDGGNYEDSDLIYSYLKELEITHLDYMVASHAHEDHVGGLSGALNYATVGTVYCPVVEYDSEPFGYFKKYVEKAGAFITVPSVGDTFSLGSAKAEILGVNSGSEPNNTSIILKVTYGETAFLFTGDAEKEAEDAVLNIGCNLSSTVLKVGHHGSADSTSFSFLREVSPSHAIISVGKENGVGHPAKTVLERLQDAGVEVYRTDLQGDIIVCSDGRNISVTVEKNPDADVFVPQTIVTPEPTETPVPTESPTAETSETSESVFAPEFTAEPDAGGTRGQENAGKTYVLNTNTMKFHKPSCSSVETIKASNYAEYVGTAAEVEAMGYVGCKRCNPY